MIKGLLVGVFMLVSSLAYTYEDYYEFVGYVVKTKTSKPYPFENFECKVTVFMPYGYDTYLLYPPIKFRDGSENKGRTKQCHIPEWTKVRVGSWRKWHKDKEGVLQPLKKGELIWLIGMN